MLLSRGTALIRAANAIKTKPTVSNQVVRKSHDWYYRECIPPQKDAIKVAEFVGGFAWWWVLWHLWTEPGHILGEFEYPDASKWTDEELGIPPE
ncbi:NADH dehydrogenase [ubiquinone] 1 beta subcomplex subunit 2, mitochondrial-like [Atheta coriaria]|uniref:NADH dehydrogenase [ubiquinone] 1 beta subcomplex subunit 2, mitochondrial-like n=1 Tax=Dalotia coriaria TaxID=877792 RepID=UPI0031F3C2C0